MILLKWRLRAVCVFDLCTILHPAHGLEEATAGHGNPYDRSVQPVPRFADSDAKVGPRWRSPAVSLLDHKAGPKRKAPSITDPSEAQRGQPLRLGADVAIALPTGGFRRMGAAALRLCGSMDRRYRRWRLAMRTIRRAANDSNADRRIGGRAYAEVGPRSLMLERLVHLGFDLSRRPTGKARSSLN